MRDRLRCVLAIGHALCSTLLGAETLVLEGAETAGISMFRRFWDTPLVLSADAPQTILDRVITNRGGQAIWSPDTPSPMAFDALNRMLLLRFPKAAETLYAELRKGRVVVNAEILLPYRDEELWPVGSPNQIRPDGYGYRMNWGVDKLYRERRPRWHAVAWALRRPWQAHPQSGPTFNAAINGKVFWTRYGASDPVHDRYAQRLGPVEVSHANREGRLDVTGLLNDPAFGPSAAFRLRQFADCGVMLMKWEVYDHLFYQGVYEFATSTGGRAILIGSPTLIVTLAPGPAIDEPLPPPVDVAALAAAPTVVGSPTAVMPTAEQLAGFIERHRRKPEWMPDWQWERVRELAALDSREGPDEPFFYAFVPPHVLSELRDRVPDPTGRKKKGVPGPIRSELVYAAWVDSLIGRQPRGWSGFESAREMAQWHLYGDTLPEPARDAIRRYWEAWLMPDRPTAATARQRVDFTDTSGHLIHPMADDPRVGRDPQGNPPAPRGRGSDPALPSGELDTYYARTGDWQGNKSFFRSGFTRMRSTQNFNTTATAGALLAGGLPGSDLAMADGRYGLERFLLREWAWADGSSQEHIDHYYFAATVSGNKAIADYGPTSFDRLAGRSLLAKNIEELVSAYHPGLRRFVAGSARTSLEYVLATQDGLQYILHTLSRQGALRERGNAPLPGNMTPFGREVPPRVVYLQTQAGPWAPEWVAEMVDGKPLPYWAVHRGWGGVWRKCWLGRHYGLASTDRGTGRFHMLGHWRRTDSPVSRFDEVGTLDVRYGCNETRFANMAPGWIFPYGTHAILQHHNKMIVITSPRARENGGFLGGGNVEALSSLQTSVGLFNYQNPPTWEVYVDGRPVQAPWEGPANGRVTVKDGVSYLAFIPLAGTDLGRTVGLGIVAGKPQAMEGGKTSLGPALVINAYNFKSATPVGPDHSLWKRAPYAWGGFYVEMGDATEHGSFEQFQRHVQSIAIEAKTDDDEHVVTVTVRSGADELVAASRVWEAAPAEEGKPPRKTGEPNLARRLANGTPDLPPAGILRDTPYGQEGFGAVAKNGARLEGDTNRHLFLLTEPKQGVVCGWNPLPDLTSLTLTLPGGRVIASDGLVGLTCVTSYGDGARVEIATAFKPGQASREGTARRFLLRGFPTVPTLVVNGQPAIPVTVTEGHDRAWAVPLPSETLNRTSAEPAAASEEDEPTRPEEARNE